jgi:uncharacterized membrane protein
LQAIFRTVVHAGRGATADESRHVPGTCEVPGTLQAIFRTGLTKAISAALLIASIPLLASLPFIAWNAEGFASSILFSVTRNPADHFGVASADGLLGWAGIPAKLPMLALMALAYLLAWRQKIGMYTGTLLVMATFVDFNSVLFRQYLAWVVPFIPLVACDLPARRAASTEHERDS